MAAVEAGTADIDLPVPSFRNRAEDLESATTLCEQWEAEYGVDATGYDQGFILCFTKHFVDPLLGKVTLEVLPPIVFYYRHIKYGPQKFPHSLIAENSMVFGVSMIKF
ncbi:hypothetical protein AArcMg_4126 (plasmid) [Natrarchaeobaculum sulfurireducens]|uniref:Uncharacterized protein n=1 Tax=Natrarchaeobaculum sulfurireducens TaxID=2044521 RepID=A0A346PKA6_9EURY|nr:hypothetical protein AArcMg_4126 [Natrarchaeobaculum sulfurireducens]